MRNKIQFRGLVAAGLLILFFSCNSDSGKKDKPTTDKTTADTTKATPPPTTPPPGVEMTAANKKCFENDGLKYKTSVSIFSSEKEVSGTVTSEALDDGTKQTADFTGSIAGDQMTITFKGSPPVIGAASEWTKKPWTIKKAGGKETLLIVFNAKNYDTNKWEETTYEFTTCH